MTMGIRSLCFSILCFVAIGCKSSSSESEVSAVSGPTGSNQPAGSQTETRENTIASERPGHTQCQTGYPYDIQSSNCHNAANAGVRENPKATGIIKCGGYPELGSPEHHTFNYRLNGNGTTTFWNWGTSCTVYSEENPPNIHDDAVTTCVAQMCGNQFDGTDEAALPVGKKVEEPNEAYCSQTSLDANSCNTCCVHRANYWLNSELRPTQERYNIFLNLCYQNCSTRFPR